MPEYTLDPSSEIHADSISSSMFGANFVSSYDSEFSEISSLLSPLDRLGANTFRFPGGTVTEHAFTNASFLTGNWEATQYVNQQGNTTNLTPISNFFELIGTIDASAQIVLPTRVAFAETMGQALASGTYGTRRVISDNYFEQLSSFIDHCLLLAEENQVNIERFEIGNEYWYGGEMTASEYGWLASEIAMFLDSNYPNIEILAQVTSSANRFSPREDRVMYLEPEGVDGYIVHSEDEAGNSYPNDWIRTVMLGTGNANTQTHAIADAFLDEPLALAALDGIIEHVYFDGGYEGVNGERDFALISVYDRFADRTGLEDLDYYITEWSPRNPRGSDRLDNLGNINGIQYSHMIVEAFFELTSNGVDGANFWPMTFGNVNTIRRTLIDTQRGDLTIGGITFSFLSENLEGFRPVIDFTVQNEISVHGFENEDNIILFVSDRDGVERVGPESISLNLDGIVNANDIFVSFTSLSTAEESAFNPSAIPYVEQTPGNVTSTNITFELAPWGLAVIDVQIVTDTNDILQGTALSDRIHGRGGNDSISGAGGDDTIKGQLGHDSIDGGSGNDWLAGGWGNDSILGGRGDDEIYGGGNSDMVWGGEGSDTIRGDIGNDELWGGEDDDYIFGDAGADTIIGNSGNDCLSGGSLSDLIFGGDGDDFINGGFGYDRINGGAGADRFYHDGAIGHAVDWIQDFDAIEGDALLFSGNATRDDFQVNLSNTLNAGVGDVSEAFVIYRPTSQVLWALIDGGQQSEIILTLNGVSYDLLA